MSVPSREAVWESYIPDVARIILSYVAAPPVHLKDACKKNKLEVLLWLIRIYGFGSKGFGSYYEAALASASSIAIANCVLDHTQQEKWELLNNSPQFRERTVIGMARKGRFKLMRTIIERLRVGLTDGENARLLYAACRKGNKYMVRWTLCRFTARPLQILSAIKIACFNGRLNTAILVYEVYGGELHHGMPRKCFERIFGQICLKGRVNIAQWFSNIFKTGITEQFLAAWFSSVCAEGRLGMLKWFMSEIPSKRAKKYALRALYNAGEAGKTRVVEWWLSTFDTPDLDVFYCICATCEKGHLRTAKTLQETYQIDFNMFDLRNRERLGPFVEVITSTRATGNKKAAKWLEKTFLKAKVSIAIDLLQEEGLYPNYF